MTEPTRQGSKPTMTNAMVKGMPVPEALLGDLTDSAALLSNPPALRARLAEDGYLFLRGVINQAAIHTARAEILARLEAVGEIVPGTDGTFTGTSRRGELEPDLGAFWQSVSEGPAFRAVSHGPAVAAVMAAVADGEVRPQDYIFLRVGVPGRATGLHFDAPFFTRMHDQVWTVWLPLGDVAIPQGPLVVVEGSHRFDDLIDPIRGFDVIRDTTRKADIGADAIAVATARKTRLLTADFRAGDLILFGMYTLHGSLDHHAEDLPVRVSCDLRWQSAAMPQDPRYFGPNPGGTTGAGYAELNGAKPLDQAWHIR